MSINFLHQNNFEQDEDLIVLLLEADKTFLQQRKLDYLNLKKTLKPNIFMSIKQKYLQFTKLIAQNAIVATVIILLAITTIGASAAEIFAPTELKPSTLLGFNNNTKTTKETSKEEPETTENTTQPLVADENHDVAVIDECDLAVRYSKKVTRQGSFELRSYPFDSAYYTENYKKFLQPKGYLNVAGSEASGPGVGFSISCYDKAYSVDEFNKENVDINNKGMLETEQGFGSGSIEQLNKDTFCNEIGMQKSSCQKDITNLTKITLPSPDGETIYYFMNYNNQTFLIEKGNYDIKRETLEIQFNSLALSTPSVSLGNNQQENQQKSSQTNTIQQNLEGVEFVYSGLENGQKLLKKTDPDGYYSLDNSVKNSNLINDTKKTYKIWGKINSNREIVEITKVEVVNTNSPIGTKGNPANLSQITLAPKNANNFQKNVSKDEFDCGIQKGIVTYLKTQTDMGMSMTINNSSLPTTQFYIDAKQKLDAYLNGSKNADDLHLYFRNYCSGYYSQRVKELNFSYPNTDISKVILTKEGNGEVGYATVNVYAKKGDNYINLRGLVFSPEKMQQDAENKCNLNNPDSWEAFNSCWDNVLKSPEYQNAAKQKAKELIDTFAL